MYDPTVGRFLDEDPIGIDGGDPNFYRYCGNSPTNRTDPTGLEPPGAGGGAPAAVALAQPAPGESTTPRVPCPDMPPAANRALVEIYWSENSFRLFQVFWAARSTYVFPFWSQRCHAWVGAMRDTLVKQFGKEYYDNEDYVITYVDWDLSNRTGHGALRILMKKTGHVYYLDIGTLGGIFDKVPKEYGPEHGIFPLVPCQPVPFWPWD